MLRTFALTAVLLCCTAGASGEKGFFGYALRTELEGSFWNPVLSKASISVVAAGSPAARAGVAVGDILLQLENIPVPGAEDDVLNELKAILDKDVHAGDRLSMRLRKADGEEYSVILVAEPRKE